MTKAEDPRSASSFEPSRLVVILDRLQRNFYDHAPASQRIAAAVLRDLQTPDESPSALPH